MAAGSNITLVSTGMLPALVVASAALTAPTAFVLLRLYRRSVLRSMATVASGAIPQPEATAPSPAPAEPLRVAYLDSAADPGASVLYGRTRRSLAACALVHAAAGIAYALVFAAAWMALAGGEGFVASRFLWLAACYAWPTAIALTLVYALGPSQRAALFGGYFLLLALFAGYALLRNPGLAPAQLVFFWFYANAAPSLLFATFLHRRVRAVGPLVLVFMVAAVTGSQLLLSFVGASDERMRRAVDIGAMWGLGGTGMFFAILIAGFLLFALIGWWLLKRLGERYRRRKTSDQALVLDAMWLMFGIVQSITLSFEGWVWLFTGLGAFALYKLVARTGIAWLRGEPGDPGVTLLLLRVFSLGARSERLFDALSKAWLRAGPITMIAGPDLVASTVEPHEFLEFVGGGLLRRFVRDGQDLERRIAAMARGPDPDGRYRVNEFFCYADTWQQTMRRLAQEADVVLMDLRSFAPDNHGCLYEIEQLLAGVDLRRVLLLVDATTDRAFLDAALRSAWERLAAHAQAARHGSAEVRLLELDAPSARALRVLLGHLLAERAAPAAMQASVAVPT